VICEGRKILELQVPLHELAEFFPIFVLHVDEFHAVPVGTNVADHGCELNLL